MPEELSNTDEAVLGLATAGEETPRKPPLRVTLLAAGCLVLLLPMIYLLIHRAGTQPVQASAPKAAIAPSSLTALESTVQAVPTPANRLGLAAAYINAGVPGRALPLLTELIAEDSTNEGAWNNLCVANTLLQYYKDGMDECSRAVKLAPGDQLAKNNLAWVTDERDKTVTALSLQEQTDGTKRDKDFYRTEGLNFMHLGNYDEAIHAWRREMELDPNSAIAANNIGTVTMLKKQPVEAEAWFQKAIALDPTLQIAKNNLAWAKDEQAKAKR